MVAKFKSMVDAGKLQVEFRGGLMLVKLPDNILFDPGKTALKSAGKEAVTQVAQILSGIEGRKFQVTGHTDNVPMKSGKYKSNWELSSARAVEVVKVMIASGMDPKRLSAAGYADQLPVAENDTVIGRLQNRRIEIVVQPNLEELPSAVQ
jgi:chemotaxis protein MotB